MNFTFLPSASVLIHSSSTIFLLRRIQHSCSRYPCSTHGLPVLPTSPEQTAEYRVPGGNRRARGARQGQPQFARSKCCAGTCPQIHVTLNMLIEKHRNAGGGRYEGAYF